MQQNENSLPAIPRRLKIRLDIDNVKEEKKLRIKRFIGLYRIMYDLDNVEVMCKEALRHNNTFSQYQGIIVTYRKCFDGDAARGASLTPRHLKGLEPEDVEFHHKIIELGHKYVAHAVSEEYDVVELYMIKDENGFVVDIKADHNLREPFDKSDCCRLLEMIKTIRNNLWNSIHSLKVNIINAFNQI